MKNRVATAGYSRNGLPYARMEGGPQNLVIFEGLSFVHEPPSGLRQRWICGNKRYFAEHFTVYYVGRKPGLPDGYSIRDMSDDYATMLREEIESPFHLMGVSTGGTIAQCFAVDHPELVQRLVLASTGYRLSERGAEIQRKVASLVRAGKWRSAAAAMAHGITTGRTRPVWVSFFWILGKVIFGVPKDPSDGLVELDAEDKFDFGECLANIRVPTLVIGGDNDCFYPVRQTAAGIPSARLVLYKKAGHLVMRKGQFNRDILAFLIEDENT